MMCIYYYVNILTLSRLENEGREDDAQSKANGGGWECCVGVEECWICRKSKLQAYFLAYLG